MKSLDLNNLSDIREIGKDQFDILYHISQMLNKVVYKDTLIAEALDLIIHVIKAERGLFARYNEAENQFSIVAARNINREKIADLSEFSSGILQKVISEKKPCLYHDVQSDPKLSQFESVMIHQIKSVIGMPIFYRGKVWGVILVDSLENRTEFSEENLIFLDFFSNLVSLALDKIIRFEVLEDENVILRNQLEATHHIPDMIGESIAMRKLAALIHRVARTNATVLILGESGTGKELVARAIHQLSARRNNPYLAQFCGSIPDTLLESELFGYKRGAFSGATTDKKGLFEVADGGTFFLDEIVDISLALQAKLLRVIQNQEINRLGDTKVKKVDVRILAATNKDLKQFTREGKFRDDLFYRLNVFPITLPPLRERREDIPLLTRHFIKKYGKNEIPLHSGALTKLRDYPWPGNIRQLENVIQRALILCDSEKLHPGHIILEDENGGNVKNFEGSLKDFEKRLLLSRLEQFGGNRTLTARSLGVSVRWVQLKLKEMDG
jgi:Nif-specific regulatory protein